MAQNMLASYSIATELGIEHHVIEKVFQNFKFLKGRGKQIKKNGYLIIDDTYNANFESFQSIRGNIKYRNNKTNKLEFLHIQELLVDL